MTKEFETLFNAAKEISQKAYAPYSNYRVGAACLAEDGRILTGCNVENAGYGVTLCAECGMVSQLIATGGGKISKFVCVNGEGSVIMPCGRCRQLLAEHAAADFAILTPEGLRSLEQILPQAFTGANLENL